MAHAHEMVVLSPFCCAMCVAELGFSLTSQMDFVLLLAAFKGRCTSQK